MTERHEGLWDYVQRVFSPSTVSDFTNAQQETHADQDVSYEAMCLCELFAGKGNTPQAVSLRKTYKPEEYLYARFAKHFGWTQLSQARDFYKRNKRFSYR